MAPLHDMLIAQPSTWHGLDYPYSRRRQSIAMPQEDQRPDPSHCPKVSHLLRRTIPTQSQRLRRSEPYLLVLPFLLVQWHLPCCYARINIHPPMLGG